MLRLIAVTFVAVALAQPSSARAEGSDDLGLAQRIQDTTELFVDILAAGERVTWVGFGPLVLRDAGGTLLATLTTGTTYTTTAAGTLSLSLVSQPASRWDVRVSTAAGATRTGRLHSPRWDFDAGSFAESAATNGSFYALVPGGTPGRTGVVELRLDGLAGFVFSILANPSGVDGRDAGRSVPDDEAPVSDLFDLYLNPPEISDFDFSTPVLTSGSFDAGTAPAACTSIVPGVNTGTFEFTSNVEGNYNLVCDLNDDGIFDSVGGDDFFQIGTADVGANTVVWDGRDADGDPVPFGTYDCQLVITVGEFHYLGRDIETSYEGMRMFSVDGVGARTGLRMFWNDTLVQSSAVPMPTAGLGRETSGPAGVDSGDSGVAALPNVNARSWGQFAGNGKGNNNTLDSFTRVRVSNAFLQEVTILSATADADTDGLTNYEEECEIGTDPTRNDSDGDGIPDDVESTPPGGGPPGAIDSDGDGIVDARDEDSDDDGVPDEVEAHDADADGSPDVPPSDDDADMDGLDDAWDPDCTPACAMNGTAAPLPDRDGDGIADYRDADDDGDGIPTSVECVAGACADTDGDGNPDALDVDSDADGVPDATEGHDVDQDGFPDVAPAGEDLDGDGLDDAYDAACTPDCAADGTLAPRPDADGDGTPDVLDVDDDDDGVGTATELGRDTDDDGTPDYLEPDDDDDGVGTRFELGPTELGDGDLDDAEARDTDGDGIPDFLEDDDDGDGVPTATEIGELEASDGELDDADALDTDGDGTLDYLDTDDDGDGVGTAFECEDPEAGCLNTDAATGDTRPDYLDPDDDGDGIDTIVELGDTERMDGDDDADDAEDSDGDGMPDYLDADDDNDGVDTRFELGETEATDGDGDAEDAIDTDGNGLPDYLDPDDDGDGLPTRDELGETENGDGNPSDAINTDAASGDLLPDYLDPDDDGDTIPTATEIADGAGLPGGPDDDVDGDMTPNWRDQDADDDGVADSAEAGLDLDEDGVPDYLDPDSSPADTDGDGRRDDLECEAATRLTDPDSCPDLDGDGTPDWLDDDDDGDGVPTATEIGAGDTDGDGTPDFADTDDDGDGIPTADEDIDEDLDPRDDDTDGNGLPDYLDPDDDGDGIPTATERVDGMGLPGGGNDDVDGNGAPNWRDTDADGDGTPDATECPDPTMDCPDGDGDGVPAYLDPDETGVDTDMDGIPDTVECPMPEACPDTDGDGTTDERDPDDDGDGVPTSAESPMGIDRDTDGDGTPDRLDPDDDGDGVPTLDEMPDGPPRDTDGDGIPDPLDDDDDGDGIPTLVEREDGIGPGGSGGPGLDADGDGVENHLDTDSDGDGLLDMDEGRGDDDEDGVPNYLDAFAIGGVAGGALCAADGTSPAPLAVFLLLLAFALRRRVPRRAGTLAVSLLVGSVFLAAAPASAQPAFELDRFRPAPLLNDGFAVGTGRDLGHLRMQGQLYLDYADDPLVFEESRGDRDTETNAVVGTQLVLHAGFALGLWDRVVLYAGLPVNVIQDGDDTLPNGVALADGAGLGDAAAGLRVRLFGGERGALALQATVTLPVASWVNGDQAYTGDRTVTGHPAALGHVRFGPVELRGNVGVRLRRSSELLGVEPSHELTYGVGAAFLLADEQLHLLAEVFGSSGFSNFAGREESPLEVLAGAKYFHASGFTAGLGAGTGLLRGVGAPDLRVIGMIGFGRAEDQDADGDGILGRDDACPEVAEDVDEFEDGDGCPDLDDDGDGVLDAEDACRLEPEDADGFQDADGCPDADNDADGIPDAQDACPNDAEDMDEFEDANGCPDPDNDGDDVFDDEDRCPNVPGLVEAAGCPAPDRDGDGVPDAADNCPDEPGTAENRGCEAPQQVAIEGDRLVILDKVYFATSRSRIQRRSHLLLDNVADVLQAHPEIERVRVEGHTDARGRRSANLRLSQDRANAVARYLVRRGVARRRIESQGFGPDRPVVPDATTDEDHARNRRVEFVIVQGEDPTR